MWNVSDLNVEIGRTDSTSYRQETKDVADECSYFERIKMIEMTD